jgi:lipopolysaccharide biosynthesis protein
LPEIFDCLRAISNVVRVIITCPPQLVEDLTELFGDHSAVSVRPVLEGESDVFAWLTVATNSFDRIDIVLKLHTGFASRSNLPSWRFQQYWQLTSPLFILDIMRAFEQDVSLGLVIPNYHPGLRAQLKELELIELPAQLTDKLNLNVNINAGEFPVGSMFWYRPDAMRKLTDIEWRSTDFPENTRQTSATIPDQILKLLTPLANGEGFTTSFVRQLTPMKSL